VTSSDHPPPHQVRHKGPPLGMIATVFVLLFIAGLYPVTVFGGKPYFPGPGESLQVIAAFFLARPSAVLLCAAFQFGAAIPLGILTATVVSQLRFLGVRAAGTYIALFGGFATAFTMMVSSSVLWTMSYPGIAQDSNLLLALYRFSFALGRTGLFRAVRTADCRRLRDRRFEQAPAEVARHRRAGDCGHRGTELARHPVPESPAFDSPHAVSGIRLAHCCRVRSAERP